AGELAGIDVDGPDVLGALADEIVERMREEPDWPGRFAVIDRMLSARLNAEGPAVSSEVGQAWRLLLTSGGISNVSALAARDRLDRPPPAQPVPRGDRPYAEGRGAGHPVRPGPAPAPG